MPTLNFLKDLYFFYKKDVHHIIGGGGGHGGRVVTLSPLRPGFDPVTASSGKAGSCLPLVGSLQYSNYKHGVRVVTLSPLRPGFDPRHGLKWESW